MIYYETIKIPDYEKVIGFYSDITSLNGYVSIHSTLLGPSIGGCRFFNYKNQNDALQDVLKLSKAMSYKNSLAGVNLGGGKMVVWLERPELKTKEMLNEIAEIVNSLNGDYIIAEDMGSSLDNMRFISTITPHVAISRDAGDPAEATAYGVLQAMKAALRFKKLDDLSKVTVLIEGLGNVGFNLARFANHYKMQVLAYDLNSQTLEKFKSESLGIVYNHPLESRWNHSDIDVYAPCAIGGTVSEQLIKLCKKELVICGSANNQLANKLVAWSLLDNRNILYVPDYLANAGGVINCSDSACSTYKNILDLNLIYDRTLHLLNEHAKQPNRPITELVDEMAEKRLNINIERNLCNSEW